MYIEEPLPFIKDFIERLDLSLRELGENNYLSKSQKYWLSFCILSILVTNSVCWARFERYSFKYYSQSALSWMFRHSKIPWEKLLMSSIRVVLDTYKINSGVISLDDSDNSRSKNAKYIHKIHKIKDKKSGGYITGQGLVLLVLVSEKITFPIGFAFYAPNPATKVWKKSDAKLRKQGVPKSERPRCPEPDKEYPTKVELALGLLQTFADSFSDVTIDTIVADALYGTDEFMQKSSEIFSGIQVISQLRGNQLVFHENRWINLKTLFLTKPYYCATIMLRGKLVKVSYSYISVKVKAHGNKKRKIVALKYEDENEYRYLIATDLSWEAETIIKTYSLRWLVEVFFQDWKSYEGWGQLTKHTGYDGSVRGLILSLLLDHCLFLHPEQKAQIENKLPAFTVGSLREKVIVENLIQFIISLLNDKNPEEKLKNLMENAQIIFQPNLSSKHMNTMDMEFIKQKKAA